MDEGFEYAIAATASVSSEDITGQITLGDEMPEDLACGEFANDWTLLEGLYVEIQEHGNIVDQGRVDVATKDGAILWLVSDGISHRRLIEKMPGRSVRIPTAQGQRLTRLA